MPIGLQDIYRSTIVDWELHIDARCTNQHNESVLVGKTVVTILKTN